MTSLSLLACRTVVLQSSRWGSEGWLLAGCSTLVVSLTTCGFWSYMSLLQDAVGLSVVCNCVSWSYSLLLAHVSQRLMCEQIVYQSLRRPSVIFSNIFSSETSGPIKLKLHMETPLRMQKRTYVQMLLVT